jgi:hypothetical protein
MGALGISCPLWLAISRSYLACSSAQELTAALPASPNRKFEILPSLKAPHLSVELLQRPTATSFRCEVASSVFGLRTARAKISGKLLLETNSRPHHPLQTFFLQVHKRTRPRELHQRQQCISITQPDWGKQVVHLQ